MIFNGHLLGKRIFLRSLTEQDATEKYCDWLRDPEVHRFLETKDATVPELIDYIHSKNAATDCLFFALCLIESGECIGTIKLEPIDFALRTATIAIMIGDKKFWGQGLGPEAMQLLIDYAFKDLGMSTITLGVRSSNVSAIRSYKKIGFVEVARAKDFHLDDNIISDQVTMSLNKS